MENPPAKIEIKEKFEERYRNILGNKYEEFIECSLRFLRRSIRVNTLKVEIDELRKRISERWMLKKIPWCGEGFWIEHKKEERRDIGNMIEHSLGYFYVQEAASMIPPVVMKPEENEIILDIAASPGSKTTQIAQYMKNTGIIIANDLTIERMKPLTVNLQRCGVSNTIVTLMHGQRISNFKFDRILVDAPCSGTGTIRKSFKTLKMWNPNMVRRLAGTQKQLIDNAFSMLKEDGVLVYSTCSLEPEENEGIIDFLIKKHENAKVKKSELDIKRSETVQEFEGREYDDEVRKCLRIWPQDNDTEGFFVAKIVKV